MKTNTRKTGGARASHRWYAFAAFGLLLVVAASAEAQTYPQGGTDPRNGAAAPDQPVQPRIPTLTPRAPQQAAPQQPVKPRQPEPPFKLTPQEETQVDGALGQWEQHNRGVKTFDCRFKRWIYDLVFSQPNQVPEPKFIELGVIRFATPDKGLFKLESMEKDGKEMPIDNLRAEHWMCDGKSVFEYNTGKKQVIEHKLPPELQGKAIANSPLPFLFGAEAQKLKQRYFIRLITPADVQGQEWLEAYPRFQQDAANFHHAIFIINTRDMSPFALRIVQPNGKDYTVYQFYDVVVNDKFKLFQADPFKPFTPWGWQLIPDASRTAARPK